jgi:replication initiation protein RepC
VGSTSEHPKVPTVANLISGQIENWPKQRVGKAADVSLKSFPLGLVLQACPEILAYGPDGNVSSWRDLMVAAVVVRSMLGVSDTAYQEACEAMGQENAATVMACVLQRTGSITSAGGYLRDLTRRTIRGEFAVGPMLMALARANSSMTAQSG